MLKTQLRLLISGSVMFLIFGLIPALPPIMFNKELFPGTRHLYTLHVEATQNGIMLIVLALMMPWLQLGTVTKSIFEISSNLGAWFNVIPWVYGGLTGAVLHLGDGQRSGNWQADPPLNNDELKSVMESMLVLCTVGDFIAWAIVIAALLSRAISTDGSVKSNKD